MCTTAFPSCTRDYKPVCGCDGLTYSNACMAQLNRTNVDYQGPCENKQVYTSPGEPLLSINVTMPALLSFSFFPLWLTHPHIYILSLNTLRLHFHTFILGLHLQCAVWKWTLLPQGPRQVQRSGTRLPSSSYLRLFNTPYDRNAFNLLLLTKSSRVCAIAAPRFARWSTPLCAAAMAVRFPLYPLLRSFDLSRSLCLTSHITHTMTF